MVGSAQCRSSKATTSGAGGGEAGEHAAHSPEELVDRIGGVGEPDGGRGALGRGPVAVREGVELGPRLVVGVVVEDARQLAQGLRDRPEGDPLAVRQAAPAGDRRPLGHRLQELGDEARLPGAGDRLDDHQARAPRLGDRRELRPERRELLVTADEPRRPARAQAAADRTPSSRNAGIGSDLPLSSSGSTASSSVDVRDQLAGERPDQHLVRAGGLLEARGDVDGVAGDEPLPRGRVARDDLAGVDAGAVLERDAEARVELGVQRPRARPASRRRRAPPARRRPRAGCGRPNTAITASPMNFSTVPPWRSSSSRIDVEVARHDGRAATRSRAARRSRSSRRGPRRRS